MCLAVSILASRTGTAASAGQDTERPLLDQLLAIDAEFLESPRTSEARTAANRQADALASCRQGTPAGERERCFLDALFGSGQLAGTGRSGTPQANPLTATLADGHGSCAALVAVALALTEPYGSPFRAAILRDHVALASKAERGMFYEALERGKRVSEEELGRQRPASPGGIQIVDGAAYIAYYLDNLGARLADAGQDDAARRAFEEALLRAPGIARIHYNFGTFLLRRDDTVGAEAHLTRAIRLGWKDADAYVNHGVALWKMNHPRAARRDFEKALRFDPRNAEARLNLTRPDAGTRP